MDYNYAITISPPKRTHIQSNTISYSSDKMVIELALRRQMFSLWPELSDEDERLHYHGTVRIKNYLDWDRRARHILKRLGYIKVKRLRSFRDHLKWILYCTKDRCIYPRLIPRRKKKVMMNKKWRDRGILEIKRLQAEPV